MELSCFFLPFVPEFYAAFSAPWWCTRKILNTSWARVAGTHAFADVSYLLLLLLASLILPYSMMLLASLLLQVFLLSSALLLLATMLLGLYPCSCWHPCSCQRFCCCWIFCCWRYCIWNVAADFLAGSFYPAPMPEKSSRLFRSLEADVLHSQMPEKSSGPRNATFYIPPCREILVPGARPGLPPGARLLWHGAM